MRTKVRKKSRCDEAGVPIHFERSQCPIANTLDFLGDRWSLLIVRDLLYFDKHLFSELADSMEGISTNILAERLNRLTEYGIISARLYQDNPPRYEYHLTARGRELDGVLRHLASWANRHIPGTLVPPGEVREELPLTDSV